MKMNVVYPVQHNFQLTFVKNVGTKMHSTDMARKTKCLKLF